MAVCTYGGKTLKEMNVEQINIKIDKTMDAQWNVKIY